MNVIQMRQQERLRKIKIIENTILKSGGLLKSEINNLILQCQSEWGTSERTLKEYVKIAQFNIDTNKRNPSND